MKGVDAEAERGVLGFKGGCGDLVCVCLGGWGAGAVLCLAHVTGEGVETHHHAIKHQHNREHVYEIKERC